VWRVAKKMGKGAKKEENRGGNVKRRQQESVAYLRAPATRKKLPRENGRWKVASGKRLALTDNVCPPPRICSRTARIMSYLIVASKCNLNLLPQPLKGAQWRQLVKRMPNRFTDSSMA